MSDKEQVEGSERGKITGRCMTLDDGREIHLYILGPDTYGWRFVSKDGDVTQIALSREAMNAVLRLHNDVVWGTPWQMEKEGDGLDDVGGSDLDGF